MKRIWGRSSPSSLSALPQARGEGATVVQRYGSQSPAGHTLKLHRTCRCLVVQYQPRHWSTQFHSTSLLFNTEWQRARFREREGQWPIPTPGGAERQTGAQQDERKDEEEEEEGGRRRNQLPFRIKGGTIIPRDTQQQRRAFPTPRPFRNDRTQGGENTGEGRHADRTPPPPSHPKSETTAKWPHGAHSRPEQRRASRQETQQQLRHDKQSRRSEDDIKEAEEEQEEAGQRQEDGAFSKDQEFVSTEEKKHPVIKRSEHFFATGRTFQDLGITNEKVVGALQKIGVTVPARIQAKVHSLFTTFSGRNRL